MTNFIEEIPGNDKVKQILTNIVQSKNIPHAFLFVGQEGVGKENAALAFAKEINTANTDIDLTSKIVKAINSLNEPYLKYIFPLPRGKNETDQNNPYEKIIEDEIEIINSEFQKKHLNPFYKMVIPRANIIKINSIRDIHKYLSLNYDDVQFRVILISQAHLMNEESQNSLLKNLEEPPEGVIFILCTDSPEKLRETIRSRCWNINFQPLDNLSLSNILSKNFLLDKNIIDEVVPFSGGSIQDVILLIDNDFEELREKTIRILRYSFGRKYHSAFVEFEEIIAESDQTKLKLIIRMILIWLNDFQKYRIDEDSKIFFVRHKETLEKFKYKFPDIELSMVTNNLDNISSSLRKNLNLNIAVSNIISQLSLLTI
ncbi:MAG: AAA family ATPase [Ignavibacteriaceae bacterium]